VKTGKSVKDRSKRMFVKGRMGELRDERFSFR
jgi:hypothetical protein